MAADLSRLCGAAGLPGLPRLPVARPGGVPPELAAPSGQEISAVCCTLRRARSQINTPLAGLGAAGTSSPPGGSLRETSRHPSRRPGEPTAGEPLLRGSAARHHPEPFSGWGNMAADPLLPLLLSGMWPACLPSPRRTASPPLSLGWESFNGSKGFNFSGLERSRTTRWTTIYVSKVDCTCTIHFGEFCE